MIQSLVCERASRDHRGAGRLETLAMEGLDLLQRQRAQSSGVADRQVTVRMIAVLFGIMLFGSSLSTTSTPIEPVGCSTSQTRRWPVGIFAMS